MRGEYQTKQRGAVLGALAACGDSPATAEQVCFRLRQSGEGVGRTTVYRTLAKLCAEGVVCKCASPEPSGGALYQLRTCAESHLHIRCVDCGAVLHLHCDEARAFGAHIEREHGFRLMEERSVLYGYCAECAAARREKSAAEGATPPGEDDRACSET